MDAKELREILRYNPETGAFIWLKPAWNQQSWIGKEAGSPDAHGYICIEIGEGRYKAHRLAWLYMTGAWPESEIDHINLVKYDNSWDNLREVNRSQQHQNGPLQSNNTSGHKGVSWYWQRNKWRAYIKKDGKRKHLGFFLTKEEAAAAYRKAAEELFGEFARPI